MKKVLILVIVLLYFCYAGLNKSISFSSEKIKISRIIIGKDNNNYQKVSYGNENKIHLEGYPSLPVIYKQYIISADEAPDDIICNTIGKPTEYKLDALIMPSQKDIFDPNYNQFVNPNAEIYQSDKLFPENPVEFVNDGWLGGNHIVQVAFYPIQYNPSENTILFHNDISFQLIIKSVSNKPLPVKQRSKCVQSIYDSALKMTVDNDEDIPIYQVKPNISLQKSLADSADLKYYDYVIITTDSLISAFDEFVEWKMRKGMNIGVVDIDSIISAYPDGDEKSGIDDDAGSVRQYLINAYENGTAYVLIGGDDQIVPVRYCTNTNIYTPATDLYYSDLTNDWDIGNNGSYASYSDEYDTYPEVYVGRITASNSKEIKNWIHKLLIYEVDPGRGDPSYLTDAFITQADEMQDGDYAGDIEDFIDTIGFSLTILEEDPSHNHINPTSPTAQQVINQLNDSYGLTSLIGHGSRFQITVLSSGDNDSSLSQVTTFDAEDGGSAGSGFENLTNYNKPGIHYSISCANCEFDETAYFNTNDGHVYEDDFSEAYLCNSKAGGVAFIGNTVDHSGVSGKYLFIEFLLLLREGNTHIGVCEGVAKAGRASDAIVHNLFGCPETMMWTDVPDEFSSVSITDNTTYITANAGEADCNICVSADDPDDYWKAVDSTQTDTFQTTIRPLHVVITKSNKLPYINLFGLQSISNTITLNNKFAYTIRNDITITSTGQLNIEPGTTLRFCEDKELKVYGELNVNGTEESPVVFTSDDLDAGSSYWDGVRAYSGGEIDADNLKIYNATCGVRSDYAKVTLDSCLIKDTYLGVAFYNCTGSNSCTVNRSSFENNYSFGIYYYNSNGNITRNSVTNSLRGIYTRGDVNIKYNDLTDFTYDAIRCENYDGDIQFNDMSDCRYGIYFMSSASGDMMNTWETHLAKSTAKNNVFSTPMRSCVFVSSTATPNIGTYLDMFIEIDAGWNEFCNPTNYDIHSVYSGTIKAEGNWWGTRAISGTVDYTPIADDITSSLMKMTLAPEIDTKFNQAYLDEKDSLYQDAIDLYLTLIKENAYNKDVTIIQKAINRLRGCYRAMDQYNKLDEALTEISSSYSDSYAGYYAEYLNSSQYCLGEEYPKALQLLDNSYNGLNDLDRSETAAFVLLDKIELLDYLAERDEKSLNKTAYMNAAEQCKQTLLTDHEDSEAAKILQELLGMEEPLCNSIPSEYNLGNPYPNPFNPVVNIPYELPEVTQVQINIYDIAGKKVQTVVDRNQLPGRYNINFNASHFASGVYIVRISCPNYNEVRKMLLLK